MFKKAKELHRIFSQISASSIPKGVGGLKVTAQEKGAPFNAVRRNLQRVLEINSRGRHVTALAEKHASDGGLPVGHTGTERWPIRRSYTYRRKWILRRQTRD